MDQFLDNLPKLTQDETDNMNRPRPFDEIELISNNFPRQKAPGPDGLASEFYKMLMEEIMPRSHNLSQRIETEETTSNLFCQVSIILILNPKTLQETTDDYHS